MRLPRAYTLPRESIFHLMWRAINGEFFLDSDEGKEAYLDRLFKFFGVTAGNVMLYAFVVLSNHAHQAAELQEDSTPLSNWLRSAHSSIGLWINHRLHRRGPVAQDRPKTVVAQNQEQLKRIMFYLDWNPVRAGMCQHPSEYRFSSYRYYAFGEVNRWTKHLSRPRWYQELASTDEERQLAYRQKCDEYYYGGRVPSEAEADQGHMLGDPESVKQRNTLMRTVARFLTKRLLLRAELDSYTAAALAPSTWVTDSEGSQVTAAILAKLRSLEGPPRRLCANGPPSGSAAAA